MSCFDLTHAPVATAARAAATGLVSMSTRPDPEGSVCCIPLSYKLGIPILTLRLESEAEVVTTETDAHVVCQAFFFGYKCAKFRRLG